MTTISFTEEKNKGSNPTVFDVTNWTSDFALNCDANDDLATADVLGTLIAELVRQGIIRGSVATA